MTSATQQLIDLAERLRPTGEIGDGMVAQFHDLARRARAEQPKVGNIRVNVEARPASVPFAIMDGGRCRNCGCPR